MKKLFLLVFTCYSLFGMQDSQDAKLAKIMVGLQKWDEKKHTYQESLKNHETPVVSRKDLNSELADNLIDLKNLINSREKLSIYTLGDLGGIACDLGSLSIVRDLICQSVTYDHFLDINSHNSGRVEWFEDGRKNIQDYIAKVESDVKKFKEDPVRFESQELKKFELFQQVYYAISHHDKQFEVKHKDFVGLCNKLIEEGSASSELLEALNSLVKHDTDENRLKIANEIIDRMHANIRSSGLTPSALMGEIWDMLSSPWK